MHITTGSLGVALLVAASLGVGGCSDSSPPGSGSGSGSGGDGGVGDAAVIGAPAADLGAFCDAADACSDALECLPPFGCTILDCPGPGPGAAHGCPSNGFCYTVDRSTSGVCAAVCETDADCAALDPEYECLERASTEAWSMKICLRR